MNDKELKVEEVLERLKNFYNVSSLVKLAKKLGINESTLAGWKQRNSFNLVELYPKIEDINWHWLITGEGEMRWNSKERQEKQAMMEYLLRRTKELESENEVLKKLYQEAIQEKEILRKQLEELAGSTETVKVPKITLPDEGEIYLRETEKGGGIYARSKKLKEKEE